MLLWVAKSLPFSFLLPLSTGLTRIGNNLFPVERLSQFYPCKKRENTNFSYMSMNIILFSENGYGTFCCLVNIDDLDKTNFLEPA